MRNPRSTYSYPPEGARRRVVHDYVEIDDNASGASPLLESNPHFDVFNERPRSHQANGWKRRFSIFRKITSLTTESAGIKLPLWFP